MRPPLRHDPPRVQHNNLIAQGKHFLAIVRHKKNWNAVILVPLAQIADERRFRRTVQRRQRLIEQQWAWFGHQRARQRDTLPLASGDLRRPPVAYAIDADLLKYLAAARLPLGRAQRAQTISDVLPGGQVREQRQVLMYVPDAPLPGGDVPLLLRVVKVFTANRNAPVIGIGQSRNAIQQRRFPRARSAEQNRESGQSAEVDIHVEAAFGIRKAFADADFEFGRDCLRRCWSRGLWRGSSLHFHGPTDHGRRFKPYTTDSRTKETARSTSAVWFALE